MALEKLRLFVMEDTISLVQKTHLKKRIKSVTSHLPTDYALKLCASAECEWFNEGQTIHIYSLNV